MSPDLETIIRGPALDKRRAKQIERESRKADVLRIRAETALLRREAVLSLPTVHRFLTDDADPNAVVWSMRHERLEELAATLEWLYEELPEEFTFEALWVGEAPTEKLVSRAELARIVRAGRIETRARYRVPAATGHPT